MVRYLLFFFFFGPDGFSAHSLKADIILDDGFHFLNETILLGAGDSGLSLVRCT